MVAVDSISGNGSITINPTNELIVNNTLMMQGYNIVKLGYPVNADDSSSKQYVDDAISSNNSTLSVFSLNNVIPSSSPQNGQPLVYLDDGINPPYFQPVNIQLFMNNSFLGQFQDVTLTAPTNGQVYAYNSTTSMFEPTSISGSIAGASDYDNSVPATDLQVIQYDAGLGKFHPVTFSSGASTLASLTDVQLGTLSDKQSLQYDQSLNKWTNQSNGMTLYYYHLYGNESIPPYTTWPVTRSLISSTNLGNLSTFNMNASHARRGITTNALGTCITEINDYTWKINYPGTYNIRYFGYFVNPG